MLRTTTKIVHHFYSNLFTPIAIKKMQKETTKIFCIGICNLMFICFLQWLSNHTHQGSAMVHMYYTTDIPVEMSRNKSIIIVIFAAVGAHFKFKPKYHFDCMQLHVSNTQMTLTQIWTADQTNRVTAGLWRLVSYVRHMYHLQESDSTPRHVRDVRTCSLSQKCWGIESAVLTHVVSSEHIVSFGAPIPIRVSTWCRGEIQGREREQERKMLVSEL